MQKYKTQFIRGNSPEKKRGNNNGDQRLAIVDRQSTTSTSDRHSAIGGVNQKSTTRHTLTAARTIIASTPRIAQGFRRLLVSQLAFPQLRWPALAAIRNRPANRLRHTQIGLFEMVAWIAFENSLDAFRSEGVDNALRAVGHAAQKTARRARFLRPKREIRASRRADEHASLNVFRKARIPHRARRARDGIE